MAHGLEESRVYVFEYPIVEEWFDHVFIWGAVFPDGELNCMKEMGGGGENESSVRLSWLLLQKEIPAGFHNGLHTLT